MRNLIEQNLEHSIMALKFDLVNNSMDAKTRLGKVLALEDLGNALNHLQGINVEER